VVALSQALSYTENAHLQDGARVQLVAELGWARDAARSAQAQRSAMKLLAAKNAELQEQVCNLGIWELLSGSWEWELRVHLCIA